MNFPWQLPTSHEFPIETTHFPWKSHDFAFSLKGADQGHQLVAVAQGHLVQNHHFSMEMLSCKSIVTVVNNT